jgi:urease accessory protein
VIGPYSAHRLLLWDIKQLVERTTTITWDSLKAEESSTMCNEDVDDWWDNDKEWSFLQEAREEDEPVTTWPLGEIVASRHDQLFTKVFNS